MKLREFRLEDYELEDDASDVWEPIISIPNTMDIPRVFESNGDNDNECPPRVMIEGSLLPDKVLPSVHILEALRAMQPWMDKCLEYDPSLKDAVSSFQKALLAKTVTARLEDYFSFIPLSSQPRESDSNDEDATNVGFKHCTSSFHHLACDCISNRKDTVIIDPCGYQKGMLFVQTALLVGKINFVIEPFNTIIKSHLSELEHLSPHLRMEQLFNEEEARSRRVPASYDRLQLLINETKVSKNRCRSRG
jgi:hypothetical protein